MKRIPVLALVGVAAVFVLSADKAAAQGVYQGPGSSTLTTPPPVAYPVPVYYPTPVYTPAPVVYGSTAYYGNRYYGNRYYGNRYSGNRYYGNRSGYGARGGYRVGFRR